MNRIGVAVILFILLAFLVLLNLMFTSAVFLGIVVLLTLLVVPLLVALWTVAGLINTNNRPPGLLYGFTLLASLFLLFPFPEDVRSSLPSAFNQYKQIIGIIFLFVSFMPGRKKMSFSHYVPHPTATPPPVTPPPATTKEYLRAMKVKNELKELFLLVQAEVEKSKNEELGLEFIELKKQEESGHTAKLLKTEKWRQYIDALGKITKSLHFLKEKAHQYNLLYAEMDEDIAREILKVQKNTGFAGIKIAYRKLALEYHPDINKTEKGKKWMGRLNEAYAFLDPNKQEVKKNG